MTYPTEKGVRQFNNKEDESMQLPFAVHKAKITAIGLMLVGLTTVTSLLSSIPNASWIGWLLVVYGSLCYLFGR